MQPGRRPVRFDPDRFLKPALRAGLVPTKQRQFTDETDGVGMSRIARERLFQSLLGLSGFPLFDIELHQSDQWFRRIRMSGVGPVIGMPCPIPLLPGFSQTSFRHIRHRTVGSRRAGSRQRPICG